jgi:DNA primase
LTHEVKLSSADRVLFPDDGVTKGDLFEYYGRIGDVLVPHLKDRPFTMKRWREGIAAGAFFQKQAPKGIPDWIPTREFRTWPRGGKGGWSTSRSSTAPRRSCGWCRCTAST